MVKKFERVILTENLKDSPFVKGDVGTIVMTHPDSKGFEVEFFALDGSTLGVETVSADHIKSATGIKRVIHIEDEVV